MALSTTYHWLNTFHTTWSWVVRHKHLLFNNKINLSFTLNVLTAPSCFFKYFHILIFNMYSQHKYHSWHFKPFINFNIELRILIKVWTCRLRVVSIELNFCVEQRDKSIYVYVFSMISPRSPTNSEQRESKICVLCWDLKKLTENYFPLKRVSNN